ncbi:MAG TPA: hypothetical protein VE868_04080 [Balneolaceae bacterium]|nr:hypothetical protein [Balneolaceae bacterium]
MRLFSKTTLIVFIFIIITSCQARSQSIKLLGSDVVNGAINGLALGGATMALQNSPDRGPLRFGLGSGILYGLGIGIYDNSIVPNGQQFYKFGTFNNAHNSTVIVLLDTIYGAAGGAIIGSAISLISQSPVLDGLQYGSGAGTWIGFGFGLIDSFVLSKGPNDLRSNTASVSHKAPGMIQINPIANNNNMSLGFLNPSVFSHKIQKGSTLERKFSMDMQIVNLKVGL